jgi:integrase
MDRRAAPGSLLRSFERHLRAQNRSERTVGNYLESARLAKAFLEGRGKRLEEATQATSRTFSATSIIMLLLDSGARRAELADLQLAHVDLDLDVLLVFGRVAASGPCRSDTRPARPSSATSASAPATSTPTSLGCGSA